MEISQYFVAFSEYMDFTITTYFNISTEFKNLLEINTLAAYNEAYALIGHF